jgi:hypothetical protein
VSSRVVENRTWGNRFALAMGFVWQARRLTSWEVRVVMSRRLAIALAVVGFGIASSTALHAAEEAAPSTFVSLRFEGACDDKNNKLFLVNKHTFKTIVTRVRWNAAGGKDLSEEFYPAPNSSKEIGCAADAEILAAEFAAF